MTSGDKFCAGCGTRLALREHEGRERPVCPQCGRVVFYDPKLAATCVIERDGRTLMVKRAVQTGYGLWSMPGGYVDRGEPVEIAAAREVMEESGSAGRNRPADRAVLGCRQSGGGGGVRGNGSGRRASTGAGVAGRGVFRAGRSAAAGVSPGRADPKALATRSKATLVSGLFCH